MSDAFFIRWVPDLPARLSEGADPEFYDVEDKDYVPVPQRMAARVNQTCLAAGVETILLRQRGVSLEEEPSTLFVIDLNLAPKRAEWKGLVQALAGFISADVEEAAKVLIGADVLERVHDEAFDALTGCATLRNGLLRINAKKRAKTSGIMLSV